MKNPFGSYFCQRLVLAIKKIFLNLFLVYMQCYLIMVYNLHLPSDYEVRQLFMCTVHLQSILLSTCWYLSIHFSIELFSSYWFIPVLCIFQRWFFCWVFQLLCGLLSILLMMFLGWKRAVNFNVIQIFIFYPFLLALL